MRMTARHLVKTAPCFLYSSSLSGSPIRPLVMNSSGLEPNGSVPRSTFTPGMMPRAESDVGNNFLSSPFSRSDSEKRMMPERYCSMPSAPTKRSRYCRRVSAPAGIPYSARRAVAVCTLSSAARRPLFLAKRERAIATRSVIGAVYHCTGARRRDDEVRARIYVQKCYILN